MKYSKPGAALFSFFLLVLVGAPLRENWRAKPQDSFPLSYYPMFSKKRSDHYSLYYFVGYDEAGIRYPISYKHIGTGGFNQARRQVNKMCKEGKGALLAEIVAEKLGESQSPPWNSLQRVELVKGTYKLEDYFMNGKKMPKEEKLIAAQKIRKP